MKKLFAVILALSLLLTAAVLPAMAEDEVPQPEGGKKFEGYWVLPGMYALICYEEEGYRVEINRYDLENSSGNRWSYNCHYNETEDTLVSIFSEMVGFTFGDNMRDPVYGEPVYTYDLNTPEGKEAVFAVTAGGKLTWKDGEGDAGNGLEFAPNGGSFEGNWKQAEGETDPVKAKIMWNGLTEDEMFFTVYVTRGEETADTYTVTLGNCFYDPATKKIGCEDGVTTVFTRNAEGGYDTEDEEEATPIFFSFTEDGKLMYEAANGIIMTEDFDAQD